MRDSATPPWMGGGRGGGSPWSLLRGVIVLLLWSVAAPTARGQNIEKQEFRITGALDLSFFYFLQTYIPLHPHIPPSWGKIYVLPP